MAPCVSMDYDDDYEPEDYFEEARATRERGKRKQPRRESSWSWNKPLEKMSQKQLDYIDKLCCSGGPWYD